MMILPPDRQAYLLSSPCRHQMLSWFPPANLFRYIQTWDIDILTSYINLL